MRKVNTALFFSSLLIASGGFCLGGETDDLINMVKRFTHFGETKGDIHSLDPLFADDFVMYEQGGKDPTWASYRDHHLGPEMKAMTSFKVENEKVTPHISGNTAWILQTMTYHIEFKSGKSVHSRATVTYVIEKQAGGWKFKHIHWSFRAAKTDHP